MLTEMRSLFVIVAATVFVRAVVTGGTRRRWDLNPRALACSALKDGISGFRPTGACLHTLAGHTHWVFSVCAVSAGVVASASADQTVRLWSR